MKVQSTEKERVVVLLRASSKQQTDREHDFDIPQQKSILIPFVDSQGWELVKVFTEGGVSGFKVSANNRDAIQDIKKMADNREFDRLVIYMSDRLGRIADETPLIVSYLNQRGIIVFSYTEGEISARDHTNKLITYIRYWQAEGESRKTSQRVSDAIGQAVSEGRYRGGGTAYGYKMVNNGRNNYKGKPILDITIDEENESPIVRTIFYVIRELNYGFRRMAQHLNDNGHRTRNGGLWTATQIRQIVNNPLYKGYYVLKSKSDRDEIISPLMENLIIIPEAEWNATHEVIRKRSTRQRGVKTTTHGTMLLSGLLFCGYCGRKLTSFQAKSRTIIVDGEKERKFIPKYRCSSFSYPQEDICKGQSTYSAQKVENAVVRAIKRYMATLNTEDVSVSYVERLDREIEFIQGELARLREIQGKAVFELSALKDEVVKALIGESGFDSKMLQELLSKKELEVKASTEQVEMREQELSELLERKQSAFSLNIKMQNWNTDFDTQEVDGQKAMLFQVVDRIDIFRDRVEISVNIKLDMFKNGISKKPTANPTGEYSDVGGVNSVSLSAWRALAALRSKIALGLPASPSPIA